MSRTTWNFIKHSKNFYVITYRRVGTWLVLSMLLNVVLGLGIHYSYFHEPSPTFYSTDGVTPPTELTPMDERNYTSVPLLASDVETTQAVKVIPQ